MVLRHNDKDEQKFKVGATTTFAKIFEAYVSRVGAESAAGLKFMFDGETLDEDDTPADADMDVHDGTVDGDVNLVDVYDK